MTCEELPIIVEKHFQCLGENARRLPEQPPGSYQSADESTTEVPSTNHAARELTRISECLESYENRVVVFLWLDPTSAQTVESSTRPREYRSLQHWRSRSGRERRQQLGTGEAFDR